MLRLVEIVLQWLFVSLDVELVGLLYRRHIFDLSSHAVFLGNRQNDRNMPIIRYFGWLLLHALNIFLHLNEIKHGMVLQLTPAHPLIRVGEQAPLEKLPNVRHEIKV